MAPKLIGSELVVNGGGGMHIQPAIEALPRGKFVIVWTNPPNVKAQIFTGTGERAHPEFRVNADAAVHPHLPAVVLVGANTFAVAWIEGNDNPRAFLRLFKDDGSTVSDATAVSANSVVSEFQPVMVSGLKNGRFAVIWASLDLAGGLTNVLMQLFEQNGSPVGPVRDVATTPGVKEFDPVGVRLPGGQGRFVIGWRVIEGVRQAVKARIFNGDGSPSGEPVIDVSNDTSEPEGNLVVTSSGDGFVAGWTSKANMRIRFVAPDGKPRSSVLHVTTSDDGTVKDAGIKRIASGDCVTSWTEFTIDPGGAPPVSEVSARFVTPFDLAVKDLFSEKFRVNTTTTGLQSNAVATTLANQFVIAWVDQPQTDKPSETNIRAQMFVQGQ
jgi:hypothetical protein